MRKSRDNEFHAKCRAALTELWLHVSTGPVDRTFDIDLRESAADLLRAPAGTSSTYRYVLPTQLLAKYVYPNLDARSVQKGVEHEDTTFDARSLASKVIVPFNHQIGDPLGNAGDPYVNNPLRVPEITAVYRGQQRDQKRWDELCRILSTIQEANSPARTEAALCQVLLEIRHLLEETTVRYPTPQRISLQAASRVVGRFLEPRTGGRRLQAVSFALFRTLCAVWHIYDEVLSAPATAADAPTDRPADIDCRSAGATVLAVEVKDRTLTLQLLEDKIASTRLARVRELLFLIRASPVVADDRVTERARSEFASGQNIYVLEAEPFFYHMMAVIGETGRLAFIEQIGAVLDELGMDYTDRRDWADQLIEG